MFWNDRPLPAENIFLCYTCQSQYLSGYCGKPYPFFSFSGNHVKGWLCKLSRIKSLKQFVPLPFLLLHTGLPPLDLCRMFWCYLPRKPESIVNPLNVNPFSILAKNNFIKTTEKNPQPSMDHGFWSYKQILQPGWRLLDSLQAVNFTLGDRVGILSS